MLSPSKSRHSSQSSPSSPEGEFAEIGSNVTILPARQQNITQQQQLKRSENAARIERRLKNTVELVFSNEAMPSPALSLLNLQITRVVLAANFKRAAVYWRTAETLESASAKAKRMGVIVPNVGVGRADIAMALKKHEAVMQMLIERHANLKVCPKVRFVDDCDTAEGMNTIEMEHE
ncbi:hypothetical protein GQ42DRAFT_162309 [Ramicandelaber brevisporus]|nr:hypothetical protein GQ42DRAFT_162309 [Ramicandelaber brevisporus]